jgi:hypothetical protein
VLARAAKARVPARYIAVAGRSKDVYDAEVTAAFTDAGVSLVLLVGYMRILSSQVHYIYTAASYTATKHVLLCLEADFLRCTRIRSTCNRMVRTYSCQFYHSSSLRSLLQ